MPLINCKINIFLTWSKKCITVTRNYSDQEPKFTIIDTKLYVPVVTSWAQDNEELLKQLKKVLEEQLTGININQHQHYRHESDI